MVFNFSLFSLLDFLTFSCTFIFALFFLSKNFRNKKANIFLSLFLLSLGFEISPVLIESFNELNHTHFNQYFDTTFFTLPFLYPYVNFTINLPFKKEWILLFIPGILFNIIQQDDLFYTFLGYVFNLSLIGIIFFQIKSHRQQLLHYYSDIESKTIQWIYTILAIFLLFHIIWITEDFLDITFTERFKLLFITSSSLLTFFLVLWVGYFGFSQQKIFQEHHFKFNHNSTKNQIAFDLEDQKQFEIISTKIKTQQLFKDSNLTLKKLAKKLSIQEKELSKLINQYSKNNFYHYINEFRIEEFKKLLKSEEANKLSILGLAEEVGFNSKSVFYSAFKRIEGITPNQYKKQLK